MRIGIDAAPVVGGEGGVGTHTTQLLRVMIELDSKSEFLAYIPKGTKDQIAHKGSWTAASNLRWIESGRWGLRWRGRADLLDLFHGPNFKMRTQGRFGGIVTIHDMWMDRAPQYSSKVFGQRLAFVRTKRVVWRARKVVTVSRFSASEISELYGLPSERVAVISNGVSDAFWRERNDQAMDGLRSRKGIPRTGFVLFVGGADPRKNHKNFLAAAARCREAWKGRSLVLVGASSHRFGNYQETAQAYGLEDHIVCTGQVTIQELRLLYSYADLFVFPSLYEGFGMPVLEAMACGSPTITSTTSGLPEVAGGAAVLVDPDDPDQLGDAIRRVLTGQQLREDLRARGLERAKQMTWDAPAAQTLALYRELCALSAHQ